MKTNFESHFISVTNFRLVCLLPIVAYTYICTFVCDPRVRRYEHSKNVLFCLSILYMDYSIQQRYKIYYLKHYSIQKIFEFWKRDTWNHSQLLFNNFNKDTINHSNHRIFIFTLLTVSRYILFFIYVWLEK
jgi:hypothetical protein